MNEPGSDTTAGGAPAAVIGIVIPCFNEARRLDVARFESFLQCDEDVRFVFVDDGSTDDTAAVLNELCARHPRRCMMLPGGANRGKGEAVRMGLRALLKDRAVDRVGYWDADLSTRLDEIGRMSAILTRRDDIDIVIGIRRKLLGHRVRRTWVRGLLARIFSVVISLALRRRFLDTQCGAKLFRRTLALGAAIEREFVSRWIFDIELLLRCTAGASERARRWDSVFEYPVEAWTPRAASNVVPFSYATSLLELPRVLWKER
ncbi:MAG: glycosyltransferase [Acidobacteriota bacterium]